MSDRLTWSTAEVAAALGVSRGWLYRHGRALHAAGFPAPLPIVRRYDPAAVRAWIASQRGEEPPDPPAEDDIAGWAAHLDRRARQLGRARTGA